MYRELTLTIQITLTVLHHDSQELDDHLGTGSQQHLPLSTLLGIVDGLQGVTENVHTHHGWKPNVISISQEIYLYFPQQC